MVGTFWESVVLWSLFQGKSVKGVRLLGFSQTPSAPSAWDCPSAQHREKLWRLAPQMSPSPPQWYICPCVVLVPLSWIWVGSVTYLLPIRCSRSNTTWLPRPSQNDHATSDFVFWNSLQESQDVTWKSDYLEPTMLERPNAGAPVDSSHWAQPSTLPTGHQTCEGSSPEPWRPAHQAAECHQVNLSQCQWGRRITQLSSICLNSWPQIHETQ